MAVLVKPGSIADIRNSKLYKRNQKLLFNEEILRIYKKQMENTSKNNNLEYDFNTFSYSECSACEDIKLARSHHCKVCNTCVLKMDHHCPWINNCVGQNNQRYFILFLSWLFIGCLYVLFLGIPVYFFSNKFYSKQLMLVLIVSFVGSLITLFFNSWNWYLVIKGFTTIEFWSGYENEFNLNDWRNNLYLIFGKKSIFTVIFCPSITRLKYSGTEWSKLIDETLKEDKILHKEGNRVIKNV